MKKENRLLKKSLKNAELLKSKFSTIITKCGNSGHISVPKHLVGKAVEVDLDRIDDKKEVKALEMEHQKRKRKL